MAGTTSRSPDPVQEVATGDPAAWPDSTAASGSCTGSMPPSMLTLLATGSALYIPPISEAVGQRQVVLAIHVYAGIAIPFPLLLTVAARRWGAAFRADARRINRWNVDDQRWLRTWGRDKTVRNGKFNAGQKLNAAFTFGHHRGDAGDRLDHAVSQRVATVVAHRRDLRPRLGRISPPAIAVTGHILYAINDSDSLRSMWTGWVPAPGPESRPALVRGGDRLSGAPRRSRMPRPSRNRTGRTAAADRW